MKKIIAIAAAAAASLAAFADGEYTFVQGQNGGMSYILVNKDLDSFRFDISKYGEETASDNRDGRWGEGHFRYYTYKGDVVTRTETSGYGRNRTTTTTLADRETGEAVGMTTIAKGERSVDLGAVEAGTKIGFAFDDRGTAEWAFSFTEAGRYESGRGYATYSADGEVLVNFNADGSYASGRNSNNWDDWMAITVSATPAQGGTTNGAPLPGALAAIAVGLAGAGALKARGRGRGKKQ